jgi:hypothetical protein
MSIVLVGSTSGSCTLQEQAVAGTTVLTLPTTSGTVLTSTSPSSDLPSSINGPAFSAYKTGDQAISTATWTKATFTNEEFDTNNNFASSRFTPTVAGYYQINSAIYTYGTVALTGSTISIYKNGNEYKRGNQFTFTSNNQTHQIVVASIVYLNGSTDYVEIYGNVNGTGSMSINEGTAGASTYFQGVLVRGA